MYVEVEDRLASPGAIVDDHPEAVLIEPPPPRQLRSNPEHVPQKRSILLCGIRQTDQRLLGDHQKVGRGLRGDIVESQALIVFVDHVRRYLLAKDLGEHIVLIVAHHYGVARGLRLAS